MRMNIITQMSTPLYEGAKTIPLSLTIRPSCGVPGDYQFATDSEALMRMLQKKTDLSRDSLKRFEGEMYSSPCARLLGVELSESVLTEIGYFIDQGGLRSSAIKLLAGRRPLQAPPQPRYLGLDVGSKRIGVAVSDELGMTAQPVLTLLRRRNAREDMRSLARLARRYSVVAIVVGNPLHLSGEKSPRSENTQAFAAELGEWTGLPIHLWDERLTTREAHQILYQAGRTRQDHRRVVDQVAAALILQSFLDQRSPDHQGQEPESSNL